MERLFPSIKSDEKLAIAVSGGGDSMALAWLMRHYHSRLVAIVVDHQLRPGSAYETQETARRLQKMGIAVRCAKLEGLSAKGCVEEQARMRRYDALFKICREERCRYLFVAHQADDQIETIYKRMGFKSGVDGLAGMAWYWHYRGLTIARPLLGVSRQALRETLRHAHVEWFDDETNEQTERGQIRKALQRLSSKEHLWSVAATNGLRRKGCDYQTRQWFDRYGHFYPQGWVSLGKELPPAFMLSRFVQAYGDNPYPPSDSSLERFICNPSPCTLRGLHFMWWRNQWFCVREYGAIEGQVTARSGQIWDGRYSLEGFTSQDVRDDYVVKATGLGLKREIRHNWPAAFCATLPCLYEGARRLAIPCLGYFSGEKWEKIAFTFQSPRPFLPKSLYGATRRNVSHYFLPQPLDWAQIAPYG